MSLIGTSNNSNNCIVSNHSRGPNYFTRHLSELLGDSCHHKLVNQALQHILLATESLAANETVCLVISLLL